jgi:acetyl-CoA carboxylase carboxyltransferase component
VPEKPTRAFDMKRVIAAVVDGGATLELKSAYGRPVITALGRFGGVPAGIVASNSMVKGGAIDVESAQKMTKFLALCNTFGLPLVFFHDTTGVLIGKAAEHAGIVRHILDVMTALGNLRVPRVAVIVRKSYGLAYLAMGASFLSSTFTFAWPSARLGFMAPDAGVRIAFGHELRAAGGTPDDLNERYAEMLLRWEADGLPWEAAGMGYIDDVIDPAETREHIVRALEVGMGQSV